MKRMLLLLEFFVVFFILLCGCAKTNLPVPEPNVQKPGDFFPLTKGSIWQYQGEGNEYASFIREIIFTSDNRAQMREDNGGTVSASVFERTENKIVLIYFQGEAYDGTNFLEQKSNENQIILKTPLEVGTKWEYRNGTREIVDINATVETPAGKFEKCIAVRITFPDSTLFEYYKEGVGMVKREFISGDSRVTSILEKYKINQ